MISQNNTLPVKSQSSPIVQIAIYSPGRKKVPELEQTAIQEAGKRIPNFSKDNVAIEYLGTLPGNAECFYRVLAGGQEIFRSAEDKVRQAHPNDERYHQT